MPTEFLLKNNIIQQMHTCTASKIHMFHNFKKVSNYNQPCKLLTKMHVSYLQITL